MHLTLIQRVTAGFIVVTLLVVAVAVNGYISQIRIAAQFEFTASTLTSLLDRSNALLDHLQNANRAMMQHANSSDEDIRINLREKFRSSSVRIIANVNTKFYVA